MKLPKFLQKLLILLFLIFLLNLTTQAQVPTNDVVFHRLGMRVRTKVGLERYRASRFTFSTMSTHISVPYHKFPLLPIGDMAEGRLLLEKWIKGEASCSVTLSITLVKFRRKGYRKVCLFRMQHNATDGTRNNKRRLPLAKLFHEGSEVTFGGTRISLDELHGQVQLVKGFIIGDPTSVVDGHISSSEFYGWIRLLDKIRGMNIAFYVEPLENAVLYNHRYLDSPLVRSRGDNAIIFEMVVLPKQRLDLVVTRGSSVKPTTSTIMATTKPFDSTATKDQTPIGSGVSFHSTDPGERSTMHSNNANPTKAVTERDDEESTPRHSSQPSTITMITPNMTKKEESEHDEYDEQVKMTLGSSPHITATHSNSHPTLTPSYSSHPHYSTEREDGRIDIPTVKNIPVSISSSTGGDEYEDFASVGSSLKPDSTSTEDGGTTLLSVSISHDAITTDTSQTDHDELHNKFTSNASTTKPRKRDPIFHSTKATPRNLQKGIRRKRNVNSSRNSIPQLMHDIIQHHDIVQELELLGVDGSRALDQFNLQTMASYTCSLCIWVQPNFADKFGLNSGLLYGVAQVIQVVKMADWILRSQDFNEDGIPDNLGLKIRTLKISDDIHLIPSSTEMEDAISSPLHPLMLNMNYKRKKKRSLKDSAAFDISNYDQHIAFERGVDHDYPDDILGNPNEGIQLGVPVPKKPLPSLEVKEELIFSKMIYSTPMESAYDRLAPQLASSSEFGGGCCARLGFIYHSLSPSLSVSSKSGACNSKENIALISGLFGTSKVGFWDLVRQVLHSVGHLMGAEHDGIMGNVGCVSAGDEPILTSNLMDPTPHVNLGLRPESQRFSECAGREIATFLTSGNAGCLIREEDEDGYCGNGLPESEEDCDCGSMSNCLIIGECCGDSDSVLSCKRLEWLENNNGGIKCARRYTSR